MEITDLYGNTVRRDNRRSTGIRKTFDIKNLWEHSHEILNRKAEGYSNKQIATTLGVSEVCVSNTVNSSLGKEKLRAMRGARDKETLDVMVEVKNRCPKALEVYDDILESEVASLALKKRVADTILLDLAGYRAPKRLDARVAHGHVVDPELLEVIKEQGRKALAASGDIIDVKGE